MNMPTAVIYDKWLAGLGGGEAVACTIARTLKDTGYDVLFLSKESVPVERIKNTLGIDLSDITFKQVSTLATNHYPPFDSAQGNLTTDLFINISFMDYSYGFAKRNIYYTHFPTPIRGFLFNLALTFFQKTNLQFLLPNLLRERINDRLRAGIYPDMQKRLDSYDTFICHSEFVKKWIKNMWRKEARVIYPPVSLVTNHSSLTTKHNWIVSVGRFFTLGHGKKQEILIEAFKILTEAVKEERSDGKTVSVDSQWQLHLIGGVGKEPSSLRYVEQLKEMAKGYPIFFHFDIKREEVEKILLQSKIYWHAGGYGEMDPVNFEHFGIAPMEAISAGCIPILFDGGGLPEIIHILGLEKEKYLFTSVEELVEKTKDIIIARTVSKKALSLTPLFSQEAFKEKFLGSLNE